jgi:hypothetical protein
LDEIRHSKSLKLNSLKNKKTLYHFILDKSGSMGDVREKTVGMFNKQVETIKDLDEKYIDQEYYTGLTTFNDQITHQVDFEPSSELGFLRYESYRPDGMTALYDAIGSSVNRISERFAGMIENDKMSVVVIVLTDGLENSSIRYNAAEIAGMIDNLERTEKWSFTILGADFDITSVSSKLNFQAASSKQYSKASYFEIEDDLVESIKSYASKKSKGIIDKEFLKSKNKSE